MQHRFCPEAKIVPRVFPPVEVQEGSGVIDPRQIMFVQMNRSSAVGLTLKAKDRVDVGDKPHIRGITGMEYLGIHQKIFVPAMLPAKGTQGIAPAQAKAQIHIRTTLSITFFHHNQSICQVVTVVGREYQFAPGGEPVRELEIEVGEIVVRISCHLFREGVVDEGHCSGFDDIRPSSADSDIERGPSLYDGPVELKTSVCNSERGTPVPGVVASLANANVNHRREPPPETGGKTSLVEVHSLDHIGIA